MRTRPVVLALACALVAACATAPAPPPVAVASPRTDLAALDAAIAGAWRDAGNIARDVHRRPRETLLFMGVAPTDTVIEITPGAGWFAEILAPYLQPRGQYIAAVMDPMASPAGRQRDSQQRSRDALTARFNAVPAHFSNARVVAFDPKSPVFGTPGSADVVLTFRNVHNWRMAGNAEAMFRAFFDVLRPGGILGVKEHRAAGPVPADDRSGYVGQDQVIALAQAAGFRLEASSEINANPRDTKDHPNGVWTLPPANRHDANDAQKYRAIGESDRMTLRFVKP